jgi:hypothetical protein
MSYILFRTAQYRAPTPNLEGGTMARKDKRRERKDFLLSISFDYVETAIKKCGGTQKEFFQRAMMAGNAPREFDLTTGLVLFETRKVIPRFVINFATLVNEGECPHHCPKGCVHPSFQQISSLQMANV